MLKVLGLLGTLALAACGGDGGGSATATEITGNLAERTAAAVPARESMPRAWFARWSFVGVAFAHNGVDALGVCAETCPAGLDASGLCPDPQPTSFCSQTDDGGFFTVRGNMSGDLCVRFADADTPGFDATMCVRAVPAGGRVTMNGMSCSHGSGTCGADSVEMEDRMGARNGMG